MFVDFVLLVGSKGCPFCAVLYTEQWQATVGKKRFTWNAQVVAIHL